MSITQHHIWFVVPAWGHLTSAGALLTRMLEINQSLAVTFVTHGMLGTKFQDYIFQDEKFPKDRFRLIANGHVDPSAGPEFRSIALRQQHESMLDTVLQACSTGSSWPHPTALILDQFGANIILPEMKKVVGNQCKTFMHWSLSAACLYSFLAPSKAGGISDFENVVQRIYEDETLRKGREKQEILDGVMRSKNGSDSFNGTVIKVPGVADMFDYEREMTNMPELPVITQMLSQMIKLAENVDGVVTTSSEALESAIIAACKQFNKVYAVGMQVSPRGWGKGLVVKDTGISDFLERCAKNSVLYIAFGSMCYPVLSPSYVPALLEVLQEIDFPFVLCLGGMMAKGAIPEDTIKAINSSGKGWIQNSWVDQQAVLQHPNIGWFLSHGGWNSVSESMAQGVPMILWPLQQGDQPINSALLSMRDEPVGFELLQIRHGVHRASPLRTGKPISGDINAVKTEFRDVLSKAQGHEGVKVRKNAKDLAEKLRVERNGNTAIKELASI